MVVPVSEDLPEVVDAMVALPGIRPTPNAVIDVVGFAIGVALPIPGKEPSVEENERGG